jgi:hypothetical protein
MRGRRYRTVIRITYAGGALEVDDRNAFISSVRSAVGADAADLSFSVSADQYSIITVAATVRAENPLNAITNLDATLNDALITTGQFEEFDVTGRVLHVSPLESADQPYREIGYQVG